MKFAVFLFCLLFALPHGISAQEIKGTYAIKNVKTGMLLRIEDANSTNGTPLVLYSPQNWKCMTWDFMHIEKNTYQLKNLFTNKTFQPKGSAKTGAALEQQSLATNSVKQEYEFIKTGKDTYLIKLKDTELYITPADANGGVNSSIILSGKKEGTLQEWSIYLQNPTM